MSNNIPIDELFRDKLSGGKEQLNLGAWANMERMLNGQNPYASEEPKRKRRILPLMILFALLGTGLTAGYFLLKHQEDKQAHSSLANEQVSNPSNTSTQHIEAEPKIGDASPSTASSISPDQINFSSQHAQSVKNRSYQNKPMHSDIADVSATKSVADASAHLDVAQSKTRGNDVRRNANKDAKNDGALASTDPNSGLGLKKDFKQFDQTAMGLLNDTGSQDVKGSDAQANTKSQSLKINRTIANVHEKRNRNGSVSKMVFDTVGQSLVEVEKTIALASPAEEKSPIRDKNYKWHPRYLVEEQPMSNSQPEVFNSQPPAMVAAAGASTPHLAANTDEKDKKRQNNEKKSVLATIGAFTGATLAKIGESGGNFFSMFGVLDPGISLGVNAALFNTKNNYGGFHAGVTNRTAISETFSIISELKFFMRNNAGYTVNDIRTVIKNYTQDTFATPGFTLHKYDVDSSTKRYNFKNFASIELPVMMSARFNNLSVYGGVNFAYNFKLNISEVNTTYSDPKYIHKEVQLANGVPFNMPAEKSFQYVRNDFGSRFGIGYAVGVSYNFNPNIYLDLRLSKLMWDNTKTNTQREISNGVTKVPFTQLSLGYKFKK